MPTYNPKDISVAVNLIPVTGYADGTDVIMVEYENDFVGDAVGVTGEAAFIEHNDRRATITLKLLATALSNDAFALLLSGNTEFAVTLTDARGNTIMESVACRIMGQPTVQYGNEIGTREWKIRALELISHVGGSTL